MTLVTSVATLLSAGVSQPYLLTNDPSSDGKCYLGPNGALSPTNYANFLNPGDQWIVEGTGAEVWVCTDPGKSVSVTQNYNTRNTVQRAPTEITAVPGINTSVLYSNNAVAINGAFAITLVNSADVSGFQTLYIFIEETPAGIVASTFKMIVWQYDNNGNLVSEAAPQYTGGGWYKLPIVTNTLSVLLEGNPAFGGGNTRKIRIIASSAQEPREYYQNPGSVGQFFNTTSSQIDDYRSAKFVGLEFVCNGVAGGCFIPSYAGRCTFRTRYTGGAAGTFTRGLRPISSVEYLWYEFQNAALADQTGTPGDVILPEVPMMIDFVPSVNKRTLWALSFE